MTCVLRTLVVLAALIGQVCRVFPQLYSRRRLCAESCCLIAAIVSARPRCPCGWAAGSSGCRSGEFRLLVPGIADAPAPELVDLGGMLLVVGSAAGEGGAQQEVGADGVALRRLRELGRARQAPERVRWERRSQRLMGFALKCLAETVAQRKAEEEAHTKSTAEALSVEVRTYFPSDATGVGINTKGTPNSNGVEQTEESAAHLLRLVFMSSPRDAACGMKPVRLHVFAAALVLDCQQHGLRYLLWRCVQYKAQRSKNYVVA